MKAAVLHHFQESLRVESVDLVGASDGRGPLKRTTPDPANLAVVA